jgi:hypothetical protein
LNLAFPFDDAGYFGKWILKDKVSGVRRQRKYDWQRMPDALGRATVPAGL